LRRRVNRRGLGGEFVADWGWSQSWRSVREKGKPESHKEIPRTEDVLMTIL